LDKALLLAKKALALVPESPQIMDTLGWIEYELGNLTEAYQYLSDALRIAPNANCIMLHLAQVNISLGQQQARELLKKLIQPSKGQMDQRQALLKKYEAVGLNSQTFYSLAYICFLLEVIARVYRP